MTSGDNGMVVRTLPAADGSGVTVRFEVHEKPAVREVKLEGAKKIKEDDLKEAVDIEAFTVPSDARVAQNVKAIKDKYLEKGLFLAEVEPVITAADRRAAVARHIRRRLSLVPCLRNHR